MGLSDPATRRLTGLLGALGFAFAWVATSPRYLALINWDNAAYLSDYAVGRLRWSTMPWDAHFVIGNLYLLGVWTAHHLGGTSIDGFRLVDALAYATASAVMFEACATVLRDRRLAILITLAWMTVWVNCFLLLTLEDNILYFPAATLLLWLSVKHLSNWSPTVSLKVGAWAGCAILISWQSLTYLAPAFYAALIGGPRARSWRRRTIEAMLVLAGMLLVLVGWCFCFAATSKLSSQALLGVMFRRPNTLGAFNDQLTHGIGMAFAFGLLHTAIIVPVRAVVARALGGMALASMCGLYLAALFWGRRLHDWRPHLLTASILLLSLLTSAYHDVDYAYLKRFDFLPIHLALLAAVTLTQLSSRRRRWVMAALSLVVVAQVSLALRWDGLQHATYASLPRYGHVPHPESVWYGRDRQSFYAYFRGIRRSSPDACRHVLSLSEVEEGQWQLDQIASLYSELPDHLVLGDPRIVHFWRAPPRIMSVKSFVASGLDQPCAWYSTDAKLLLDRD